MKALIFVPDQDSPGKKDMSQAFLPSARALAKELGADPSDVISRFPAAAPLEQRRATCTLAIKSQTAPLDVLAFVCHGWRGGMQSGFLIGHRLLLARLLAVYAAPVADVLLYACDTGRDADDDAADDRATGPGGDGGFADGLRDACEVLNRRVTVMAHATTGHCSENPYARRFAPGTGGRGGEWYVDPKSQLWPRWVRAMKDPASTLRYRFWRMSFEEIEAELSPPPAPPTPPASPPLVA